MASKAVQARARNRNGDELTLQAHESDALTLPVEQLERLHNFRPDLVDFVITQSRLRAAFSSPSLGHPPLPWFAF